MIGEQQVLGQVRRAYAAAEANHTVGRTLHELAQRALSVGKRVHSETGIDAAGASVVSVALDMADTQVRRTGGPQRGRHRRGRHGRAVGQTSWRARASSVSTSSTGRCRAPSAWPTRSASWVSRPKRSRSTTCPPVLTDADVLVSCTGCGAAGGLAGRRAPGPGARPGAQAAGDLRPRHAARRRPRRRRPARRIRRRHGPHPARAVGARRGVRCRGRPPRSSPPRLPTTWPDSGWPRSPRPSPRCASGPPTWSRPSCCGWTTGCPGSRPRTATRSPRPCGGWSTSCCTPRPSGSSSWPARPAATATPRRCVNCSSSTSRPSTPSLRANCL